MVTKDQERQALKKIKEIVESLGSDSYVGMAFNGAFRLAEENIENDFGYSCQEYIDKCLEQSEQLRKFVNESAEKERKLHETIEYLTKELSEKEQIISDQEMAIEKLETDIEVVRKAKFEAAQELFHEKERHSFTQKEVVKLKAKLFDLLYAE